MSAALDHTSIFTQEIVMPHSSGYRPLQTHATVGPAAKRLRRPAVGKAVLCLILPFGLIGTSYAAQVAALPASAARSAPASNVNTAALPFNVRNIATPKLVYLGDYVALAPVSTSPLRYNGDYTPMPSVVSGVLVYLGAGAPNTVSLPAFLTPKQISTGALNYLGDYTALPNQITQTLNYLGGYLEIQPMPVQRK